MIIIIDTYFKGIIFGSVCGLIFGLASVALEPDSITTCIAVKNM